MRLGMAVGPLRLGVLECRREASVTFGVMDLVDGLGEKRAAALEELVETVGGVEKRIVRHDGRLPVWTEEFVCEAADVKAFGGPKEREDDVTPGIGRGRKHGVNDGAVNRRLQVLKGRESHLRSGLTGASAASVASPLHAGLDRTAGLGK